MKRILLILLALSLVVLWGCGQVTPVQGTLELEPDDFDHVKITNGNTGHSFTVSDRAAITKISQYINSYTLAEPQEPANGNLYNLHLVSKIQGDTELYFGVNEGTLTYDGAMYSVDAVALTKCLEGLECATMTDQELIRYLFENDTMAELGITDENGQISLDKIANLQNACPALFELMGRPTVVESVAQYGTDIMREYVSSTNIDLREQAEAIANLLKEYFPQLSEQIDQLLGE